MVEEKTSLLEKQTFLLNKLELDLGGVKNQLEGSLEIVNKALESGVSIYDIRAILEKYDVVEDYI